MICKVLWLNLAALATELVLKLVEEALQELVSGLLERFLGGAP